MRIVADENIPFIRQACAGLGEVRLLPGRAIRREDVRDADVLFVRSVTRVDAALLEGSRVRFVGTATIGADHVDAPALAALGIAFASAPGSNAVSVAEYVVAALLTLAERRRWYLAGMTLGIIGVGNVGSRVAARARALGLSVLLNDPPLARRGALREHAALPDLLAAADVVTVHVPLERDGADPTYHLIDEAFLRALKPGAALINTSRGAVHDTRALLASPPAALVLDVWEGEPRIDGALLQRCDLATPHIAGYSFDGKARGSEMIVNAARAALRLEGTWSADALLPAPPPPVSLNVNGLSIQDVLRQAVRVAYDIEADDARLRATQTLPEAERALAFDQLRKEYPIRREFARFVVSLRGACRNGDPAPALRGLGFAVAAAP